MPKLSACASSRQIIRHSARPASRVPAVIALKRGRGSRAGRTHHAEAPTTERVEKDGVVGDANTPRRDLRHTRASRRERSAVPPSAPPDRPSRGSAGAPRQLRPTRILLRPTSKGGAGLLRPQIRPDASCGVESVLWLMEASRELLQDRLGPRLTWARASTPRTHQYCSVRQAAEQRRSNLAPPTDPPDGDATRLKHSVQMLRAPPPVCEVVVPSGRMPLGRLKPL